MNLVDFTWTEDKNAINRIKHKLDFNDAIEVFDDEYRIEIEDALGNYGEERIQVIGLTSNGFLMVLYTEREAGNVAHIFSARQAEPPEKRLYLKNRNR